MSLEKLLKKATHYCLALGIGFISLGCVGSDANYGAVCWKRDFPGKAVSQIQPTEEGGYIGAGKMFNPEKKKDNALLLKLDQLGNEEWAKTYGNSDDNSWFYSFQPTFDDNGDNDGYIIAGSTRSEESGRTSGLVLKTDLEGELEWETTYDQSGYDRFSSIQLAPEGGSVVVGVATNGLGYFDGLALKLDSQGEIEWGKTFHGGGNDQFSSVQLAQDGNFLVVGASEGGVGSYDGWVLKLDSQGEIQWEWVYGNDRNDQFSSIQPTADGGYIIVGSTKSYVIGNTRFEGSERSYGWVSKTSLEGELEWGKIYGGSGDNQFSSIQPTPDQGFIIVGSTQQEESKEYDILALKLDSEGEMEWAKIYDEGGDNLSSSVQPTLDNGLILAGITLSQEPSEYSGWIIKSDSEGEICY